MDTYRLKLDLEMIRANMHRANGSRPDKGEVLDWIFSNGFTPDGALWTGDTWTGDEQAINSLSPNEIISREKL